jgi:hypothetical protein
MKSLPDPILSELAERFLGFNDALLNGIELKYSQSRIENAIIHLQARTSSNDNGMKWVYVELILSRVSDLCIKENGNVCTQVLSSGIHMTKFDRLVCLDFSFFADPPESLDEQRKSEYYIAAESIAWRVIS